MKKGTAGTRLGTNGGIVGRSGNKKPPLVPFLSPFSWQEKRRALWTLSRTASSLLYPEGTGHQQIKGVGTCRWAVKSKSAGVDVRLSTYEESEQTRASFSGLQTCGLVWRCPACAARISQTRRQQLNDGLAWAKKRGYRVAMITFTARHGASDPLKELLEAMKRAKRRFHQRRDWKRIKKKLIAMITATEVTHGANGWHPHFHVLVIVEDKETEALLYELGDAWRTSLRTEGLDGAAAAFQCQGASAAGQYVGKWGAAEELTLSGQKQAKGKGKTPLQLLEAHKAGSEDAGGLWLEYDAAFKGKTQLDGLTKLVKLAGLEETSDEEAAGDERQDDQEIVDEALMNIDYQSWRYRARHRRTDILDAAEKYGKSGVQSILEENTTQDDPDDFDLIETDQDQKTRSDRLADIDAFIATLREVEAECAQDHEQAQPPP